jgi:hypothetical protein
MTRGSYGQRRSTRALNQHVVTRCKLATALVVSHMEAVHGQEE